MVVATTVRKKFSRSISVPGEQMDESPEDQPLYHSQRTRLISNSIIDDTDAMSAKSKRQDQELLREINNRMASAVYTPPSPTLGRRRPPPYVRRPSQPIIHQTTSTFVKTLGGTSGGSTAPGDDTDVSREVEKLMPVTARALRSGSVPPVMPRAPLGVPEPPIETVLKTKIVKNGPDHFSINGPRSYASYFEDDYPVVTKYVVEKEPVKDSFHVYPRSAVHLTPTADLAVREAHRNLDRIESELKTDATLSPPPSLPPTIRTYATVDIEPRRRSSSYHGRRVDLRTRSPSPVVGSSYSYIMGLSPYTALTSPTTHTSVSYSPDPKVTKTVTTRKYITDDLPAVLPHSTITKSTKTSSEGYRRPLTASYSYTVDHSPSLSTDIEALISSARTLPEPTPMSYSSSRAPVVTPSSYQPSASYGSSSSAVTGLPAVTKPKMSDTRRRVRDVLCKVKGDPHYFD